MRKIKIELTISGENADVYEDICAELIVEDLLKDSPLATNSDFEYEIISDSDPVEE